MWPFLIMRGNKAMVTNERKKVVCVLYDDPSDGMPDRYARSSIPVLNKYPDGQSLPSPAGIDFTPGELLGTVSGALGLKKYIENLGHEFIVTSDKDGMNSTFYREVIDADIVISQPFWPAYLTKDIIEKASKLKLAITAGIGSDHVDLDAAIEKGVTVAEVTFCNSISVAEHAVMQILLLVRDFVPQYKTVITGGWNIADCVKRSYDIEGMSVGCVGAGRIGLATLKRLYPFDVELHYHDRHKLPADTEISMGLTFHSSLEDMLQECDVISIHCPLHSETEYLFDGKMINKMKQGSYLINTARGKICDPSAVKDALERNHLAGYAGDVWFPQPPHSSHPWRAMPNHAMTPHTSGTSLSAQSRYAAGVREILESWFNNQPIRKEYLIVEKGGLAGVGLHSYSTGDMTTGV